MKLSDWFKTRFTKIDVWFIVWWITYLPSILPGTLLWLFTLGGFRYFHLMTIWLDYLIDKSIKGRKYGS